MGQYLGDACTAISVIIIHLYNVFELKRLLFHCVAYRTVIQLCVSVCVWGGRGGGIDLYLKLVGMCDSSRSDPMRLTGR